MQVFSRPSSPGGQLDAVDTGSLHELSSIDDVDWPAWIEENAELLEGNPTRREAEPLFGATLCDATSPSRERFEAASTALTRHPQAASTKPANELMPQIPQGVDHVHLPRAFHCTVEGCKSKGFTRKSALRRHERAHSNSGTVLECPVLGCFRKDRKDRPMSFSRTDNLAIHLRNKHGLDALANCPIDSCGAQPSALFELSVHIHQSHNHYLSNNDNFDAMIANTVEDIISSPKKCPVRGCKKQFKPGRDLAHINAEHGPREWTASAVELLEANYHIHHRTVMIACPVCSTLVSSSTDFQFHMVESHLVFPDERSHVAAWRHSLKKALSPGVSVTDRMLLEGLFSVADHFKCQKCEFAAIKDEYGQVNTNTHVMRLLNPSYLKPYRRDILKLYPGFGIGDVWSSVWDDLPKA